MPPRIIAAFAAALAAVALASAAYAHEGHDHGAQELPPPPNYAPRGEAQTEAFELVAIAQGGQLVIYLDRFAGNDPVEGATLEIETPAGPATAKPEARGIHRLDAPWLAAGGRFELIATVTLGGEIDILPFALTVPPGAGAAHARAQPGNGTAAARPALDRNLLGAGIGGFIAGLAAMALLRRRRTAAACLAASVSIMLAAATSGASAQGASPAASPAPAANGERAQRQPDGAVFVPKPVQRIFGIRTVLLKSEPIRRSVEMPGRVIPDPNASGFVQAAITGRLSAPQGGFPRLGMKVKEGDVVAYITPPLQAIDVSDLRQRQGELDQQMSIVERRLARYEKLAPSGAVAQSLLEETRLQLAGLRDRRTALDRVRRDPVPLVAPVSGVIAEGTPVAGQIAQTSASVFHIVDPARLWVEALSFEPVAALHDTTARTGSGRALKLKFRGAGLGDRSQSIPVHFAVEDPAGGLRAGQFVTVFAQSGDAREGIAVPRSAVVRAANGQHVVFEQAGAGRFEQRPVRVEPLDAERVLIAAGIDAGKRVVIQGAELLDHVR